ncbi:MAG TPA: TetR/AcrR family transcriptional regulator [Opitutaceae bacterium]
MPRQTNSRELLLEAALELFWTKGYHATSVDLICEKCGIKKGSFYHHFESKEEMAQAALCLSWESFKAALDVAFSPLLSPMERFRTCFRNHRKFQAEMQAKFGFVCGCPLFAFGAEVGPSEPALRAKIEDNLNRITKYFESSIREGHTLGEMDAADARKTAAQILSFWEGANTMARIRNSLKPLLEAEDAMLSLLQPKATAAA